MEPLQPPQNGSIWRSRTEVPCYQRHADVDARTAAPAFGVSALPALPDPSLPRKPTTPTLASDNIYFIGEGTGETTSPQRPFALRPAARASPPQNSAMTE